MALTAVGAASYYADFAQTWSYLQNVYTKQSDDTTNMLITRRSFFRNGVLSVIAQVDYQPETRTPMLASLSDYIDTSGSADGLEFVYLTLINAANEGGDEQAVNDAVSIWHTNAVQATVAGAGPMGFYDINSRKMGIFNSTAGQDVRSGDALVYGTDIASALLNQASIIIDDPYGFGNGSAVNRTARRQRSRRALVDLEARDDPVSEKAVWEAGAVALGTDILAVAAGFALFPSPDPGTKGTAAILGVVGGGILAGVATYDFVDKLLTFEDQQAPIDSNLQPTIPDGLPVLDEDGNLCIQNPEVDIDGGFDSNPDGGDPGSGDGSDDGSGGGLDGGSDGGSDGDGGFSDPDGLCSGC